MHKGCLGAEIWNHRIAASRTKSDSYMRWQWLGHAVGHAFGNARAMLSQWLREALAAEKPPKPMEETRKRSKDGHWCSRFPCCVASAVLICVCFVRAFCLHDWMSMFLLLFALSSCAGRILSCFGVCALFFLTLRSQRFPMLHILWRPSFSGCFLLAISRTAPSSCKLCCACLSDSALSVDVLSVAIVYV